MKIATWNINSVRARKERLVAWLDRHAPDVLCLQELKVETDKFPYDVVEKAGYRAAVFGQKTYNGVAILAREAPTDVQQGFGAAPGTAEADSDARIIRATVKGLPIVCVYVPNGASIGSDKWVYKLAWLERLRAYLDTVASPKESLVICGDFNVAPDDKDVARVDEWKDSVLCHGDVRAALAKVTDWGLVDVFREHHPDGGVYSWWDYRMLGFPKNNGLRIDLVYATRPAATRCTAAEVDRDERKGKSPSDHAPVVVQLD